MADHEGFTKLPNDVIEGLAKLPLNGTQYRIILIVIRYTLGFQREKHALSETFLANATRVHRKQVQRELNELISLNILTVEKEATFKTSRVIKLNRDLESYQVTKKLPPIEKDTHTGSGLVPSPGSGLATQERKLKENIKEREVEKIPLNNEIGEGAKTVKKGEERPNPFKRPLETPEQAERRRQRNADFIKQVEDLGTKGVEAK